MAGSIHWLYTFFLKLTNISQLSKVSRCNQKAFYVALTHLLNLSSKLIILSNKQMHLQALFYPTPP